MSPMTPRGAAVHPEPPADLTGFPGDVIVGGWYRAHIDRGGLDRGCWWFSSLAVGSTPEAGGRFDLPSPRGTCYLGATPTVALRERLGPFLRGDAVLSSLLETSDGRVVVSEVQLPATAVADIAHVDAARWGVNRALSCSVGIYGITQPWAAAMDGAGRAGISYAPRFSLAADAKALALFGPEGAPRPDSDRPVVSTTPARDDLAAAGLRIVEPPYRTPVVLGPHERPPSL